MNCSHLNQIKLTSTDKHVCEDCVKTGDTWVHLRLCLECGRLLRFLQEPARDKTLSPHHSSSDSIHRARGGVGLVLRGLAGAWRIARAEVDPGFRLGQEVLALRGGIGKSYIAVIAFRRSLSPR
jgi:hypothetical protein